LNPENENLRKELEEAKEKISNLLNNINTLKNDNQKFSEGIK